MKEQLRKDAGAQTTPSPAGQKPPAKTGFLSHWPAIVSVVGLLAAIGAGYAYWQYSSLHPSTDNAYIQANVVQIAPTVSGVVDEVAVKSFAPVKAGDVLLKIDLPRFEAALKGAQDRLRLAQAQKSNIEEAQAGVQRAQQELDSATIKAPVDGIVGKVLIRPGTLARAGVSLFPIVDNSHWWVDANFKETDLTRIHAGEKATVYVDIYPDHAFSGRGRGGQPRQHVRVLAAASRERDGQLDQAHAALPRARVADLAVRRSADAHRRFCISYGRYHRQGLDQWRSLTRRHPAVPTASSPRSR